MLGLIVQMWSENVWGTNPQGQHGLRAPAPRLDDQGAAGQQRASSTRSPARPATSPARTRAGAGRAPASPASAPPTAWWSMQATPLQLNAGGDLQRQRGLRHGRPQGHHGLPRPAGHDLLDAPPDQRPEPQGDLALGHDLLGQQRPRWPATGRPRAAARTRRTRWRTCSSRTRRPAPGRSRSRAAEVNQDAHLGDAGRRRGLQPGGHRRHGASRPSAATASRRRASPATASTWAARPARARASAAARSPATATARSTPPRPALPAAGRRELHREQPVLLRQVQGQGRHQDLPVGGTFRP